MSASRKALLVVWDDCALDGRSRRWKRIKRDTAEPRPDLPILQCHYSPRHEALRCGRPNASIQPERRGSPNPGAVDGGRDVMKGESDQMSVSDAVAMIHATPASDRSHFAREIWRLRREHGSARSIPF